MRKTIYIGVDPGVTGGIGILYPEGDAVGLSMPTVTFNRGGRKTKKGNTRKKTVYDAQRLPAIFRPFADSHHDPDDDYQVVVVLENTMARQGDTGITGFGMGHSKGVIEGIIWALGLPYEPVTPSQWRPKMVGVGTDKEASRMRAQRLFPGAELHQKNHEGRAEALLIAEFFRRKQAGEPMPVFQRVKKTKKVKKKVAKKG